VEEKDEAIAQGRQEGINCRIVGQGGVDVRGEFHSLKVLAKPQAHHPEILVGHMAVAGANRYLPRSEEEIHRLLQLLFRKTDPVRHAAQPADEAALQVRRANRSGVPGGLS
jgi:hypothetical protein